MILAALRLSAMTHVSRRNVVLLLGTGAAWPRELLNVLDPAEWEFVLLSDLDEVPPRLTQGSVLAVIMTPRAWSGRELMLLRECRLRSPETSLVVMGEEPIEPTLKRAFEQGATAFLRWPASPETVMHAIYSSHGGPAKERIT